ncbi:hypothetical protein V2H77_20155 [Photorhabdus sp. P32]|uniref:hypothetical protein n=1 Tax=Photorhabdus sp. P32 TaxID=3117549 RepID=UPI00311ADB89
MLSNVLFWILEYLKSLVVLGNVGSRIKYISECPKKALQLRGMTPIKYFNSHRKIAYATANQPVDNYRLAE